MLVDRGRGYMRLPFLISKGSIGELAKQYVFIAECLKMNHFLAHGFKICKKYEKNMTPPQKKNINNFIKLA